MNIMSEDSHNMGPFVRPVEELCETTWLTLLLLGTTTTMTTTTRITLTKKINYIVTNYRVMSFRDDSKTY